MLAAWKNCSSKIRCLTKFNGRQYERELIRVNVNIWEVLATKMSELVWGIKNGDLEQVRDIVENKANIRNIKSSFSSVASLIAANRKRHM
ncbi:hypothetical protein E2986_14025 [Frieseomelitta varia]|uniref:Uncharacterized protein n=1 Tax=Frieseomelitta varia TaxID=561572 RepID=A0A833VUV9_9HYME|nr:hypothetical protein E2986_14025 [Frieseomelitta varia]